MKRGEFYRVYRGSKYDPRDYRVFLVVSRQVLIDERSEIATAYATHTRA